MVGFSTSCMYAFSRRPFQRAHNSSAQFGDNTNPVEISAPQHNCAALKYYNQSVRFIWSTAVELSLTQLQSDRIQKSAYQDDGTDRISTVDLKAFCQKKKKKAKAISNIRPFPLAHCDASR